MTVTKREIIASIAILAVIYTAGALIFSSVSRSKEEVYQEYNKAVRIQSADQLQYAMDTDAGHVWAYGELKAVDPVTHEAVEGDFARITEVTEELRTQVYITTDSKGHIHVHTRHYWEEIDRETWHCEKQTFEGIIFDYGTIPFPEDVRLCEVQKPLSDIRKIYYGSPKESEGTLYALAGSGTLTGSKYYDGWSIDETIDKLESGTWKVIFWILWTAAAIFIVFAFVYAENRWLED